MNVNVEAEFEDDERRASQAVQHIAGAHHLLTILRDRLGVVKEYPELGEAMTKLEVALSSLSTSSRE